VDAKRDERRFPYLLTERDADGELVLHGADGRAFTWERGYAMLQPNRITL
jgi:hypothetical protein